MANKPKILVVACDAGGAEIVSAYVLKNKNKFNFICYAYGPAKKIFLRKKLNFKSSPANLNSIKKIIDIQGNLDLVLTGTSGLSRVEINFISIAKSKGIETAVYLDHWVNYRERFGFPKVGWKDNLPTEIWAGDKPALRLAKKVFIGQKIKFVPNQYFKDMIFEYRNSKIKATHSKSTVLFISEPINKGSVNFDIKRSQKFSIINEHDVLNYLIKNLINNKRYRQLIIRLHPSDKKSKYEYLWPKYLKKLDFKISKDKLVDDLRQASLVVGMESTALVVAYLCHKKVISILPKRKNTFDLPINIIKVKNLHDLDKYLI